MQLNPITVFYFIFTILVFGLFLKRCRGLVNLSALKAVNRNTFFNTLPVLWLVFYCCLTSVVFITVIKPLTKVKAVLYAPEWIGEVKAEDRDYTEAFYGASNSIIAYYLDRDSQQFIKEIYNEDQPIKDLNQQHINIHSPFVPLSVKIREVIFTTTDLNLDRDFIDSSNKIYTSPALAPGSLFSKDSLGVFNVQKKGLFYGIYYYDVKDDLNRPIAAPFDKGHLYSPYYWKGGDVLFYTGVYRKQDKFYTSLYLSKAQDRLIAKLLIKSSSPQTPVLKISGNSDGRLFIYTTPGKAYPLLADMKYYPFSIEAAIKNEAKEYALGYEVKFLELKQVHSVNFHPKQWDELLVIGPAIGTFKNAIFRYKLIPKEFKAPWSWPRHGGPLLLYVLLVFLLDRLFIGLKRQFN